jgi:hypothetical protein
MITITIDYDAEKETIIIIMKGDNEELTYSALLTQLWCKILISSAVLKIIRIGVIGCWV